MIHSVFTEAQLSHRPPTMNLLTVRTCSFYHPLGQVWTSLSGRWGFWPPRTWLALPGAETQVLRPFKNTTTFAAQQVHAEQPVLSISGLLSVNFREFSAFSAYNCLSSDFLFGLHP